MKIRDKYFTREESVTTKPGCWDVLDVKIFRKGEDGKEDQVGFYRRDYGDMFRTFHPFVKGDKEYALYSDDYTRTAVMELPSCRFVCGEEGDTFGFCPVDFYVPNKEEDELIGERGLDGSFGFVAGCIWGDDCTWKVQWLDLSGIEKGIIRRDSKKLGYISIFRGLSLRQAIDMHHYFPSNPIIHIAPAFLAFDLRRENHKDYDRILDGINNVDND